MDMQLLRATQLDELYTLLKMWTSSREQASFPQAQDQTILQIINCTHSITHLLIYGINSMSRFCAL